MTELEQYKRNLTVLKEQAAHYGATPPLELVNQIAYHEQKIKELESNSFLRRKVMLPVFLVIISVCLMIAAIFGIKAVFFSETVLQKITFDYRDDPQNHGWSIDDTSDPGSVAIKSLSDDAMGNVLEITSTARYAADLDINQSAVLGNVVQVFSKPSIDAPFYIRVRLQNVDGSTFEGWVKCYPGSKNPVQEDNDEWRIYTQPKPANGDWSISEVNVEEIVNETFGKNGLRFIQIIHLRFRGHTFLKSVTILKR